MDSDKTKKEAPNVRTYTDDMVRVIEDSGGTLVKKIIKEEEAHEAEKKNPAKRANRLYGLAGSIFLLLGVAVIFFFLARRSAPAPVPVVEKKESTLPITIDTSGSVDLTGLKKEEIGQKVSSALYNMPIKAGGVGILRLEVNGEPVGLRHFVALAGLNLPLDRIDYVDDNFLLGAFHGEDNVTSVFFLLQARSFQDIFPAMKVWEGKMFADLESFFWIYPSEASSYLQSKNFEDGIIENKNARILYDAFGKPALFYIFANDRLTLISMNINTAREVISRLAQSEIRR